MKAEKRADELAAARAHLAATRPHFWRPPFGYFEQPPLTPERVAAAEAQLGRALPAAYIALLERQNGGTPRYDTFGSVARGDRCVALDHLLGVGPPGPRGYSITLEHSARWIDDSDRGRAPNLAGEAILLAYDASWWVGLDYRNRGPGDSPAVIHVDNTQPDGDARIGTLAPTLADFLAGLYDGTPTYAIGFEEIGADPASLIAALESALALKFGRASRVSGAGARDRPGHTAVRPDWRRAWLPGAQPRPATLSVVRNSHAQAGYFEFPAHPECDWIIETDACADVFEAIITALADLSYSFRVLHAPDWEALGMV